MGRNDGADVANSNLFAEIRKMLTDGFFCFLRLGKAIGMAYPAFSGILQTILRMLFHFLNCPLNRLFLAANLIISNDMAAIVQSHDWTDA